MAERLKKHLSIDDQIKKLEGRGLIIDDKTAAASVLGRINYYRLSGYLHDFRIKGSNEYKPGTRFEDIISIYAFDMRLTHLLTLVCPKPPKLYFQQLKSPADLFH